MDDDMASVDTCTVVVDMIAVAGMDGNVAFVVDKLNVDSHSKALMGIEV